MRLFVAFDIPESLKRSIEKGLQRLRTALPEARWIPRNNWHATLKFLGEVPDDQLPKVEAAVSSSLADLPPITSHLTEMGAFPTVDKARVLWVGLWDDSGALAGLAASLDKGLGALGFRQDSRPLHPHITVARIKLPLPVGQLFEQAGPYDFDESPFAVSQATLYRSRLNRMGAEYQALSSFPAKGVPSER